MQELLSGLELRSHRLVYLMLPKSRPNVLWMPETIGLPDIPGQIDTTFPIRTWKNNQVAKTNVDAITRQFSYIRNVITFTSSIKFPYPFEQGRQGRTSLVSSRVGDNLRTLSDVILFGFQTSLMTLKVPMSLSQYVYLDSVTRNHLFFAEADDIGCSNKFTNLVNF